MRPINNMAKVIAVGQVREATRVAGRDKALRLLGTLDIGDGDVMPFSASAPEIMEVIESGLEKQEKVKARGFARFSMTSSGDAAVAINLWGNGAKPGAEPLAPDTDDESYAIGVMTGVVEAITENAGDPGDMGDDGAIRATLNAATEYEGTLRDCVIPLSFPKEGGLADDFREMQIRVGDQIKVKTTISFSQEFDELYEEAETTRCEVRVENVRVIARGVGGDSIDDFVL